MINHNTLTEQTEQLPPDIFSAVVNLEEVDGMHRSSVVEFQLSVGVQGLEDFIGEEFDRSVAAYFGYMSQALDLGNGELELDEATKNGVADFYHWMPLVRSHSPDAAAIVDRQVLDIAKTGFNYEAYTALNLARDDELHRAIFTISSQAANITKRSPDVQDIKDFLSSDLSKVVNLYDTKALKSEIIMRDELNNDSAMAMVEFLDKELRESYGMLGTERACVEWIAQYSPQLLMDLASKHERHSEEIRYIISNMIPVNKQESHRATLEAAEASMLEDIIETDYLARVYYRNNNPGRAFEIIEAALGKDWAHRYEREGMDQYQIDRFYKRLATTAAAITPDDKLLALLDKFPNVAVPYEARSILIRRLASSSISDAERALELVNLGMEPLMDSSLKENEPVRNLLAIFEETGNARFLQEADRRIQELKNKSYHDDVALHEFAVRKFKAATKYGIESLAEASLAEMEQNHQSNDLHYLKRNSLEMSMKAYIDLGDYAKAEECAERLFEIECTGGGVDWNHQAMLEMVNVYMDTGQNDQAVNLVRRHYFSGQPANYYGVWAAETLAKGRQHGGLHFRALNSYANWHDRLK